jgi:hypothetical protein
MLWSILIAAIPERYHSIQGLLFSLLETQGVARMSEVELLYLMDNRRRTVGAKRNALLAAAAGEYISFIDDDDDVAPTYVDTIYKAIAKTRRSEFPPQADVICFPQRAMLIQQNVIHECEYSLTYWKDREPGKRRMLDDTGSPNIKKWTGPPAHTMVWRAGIAKAVQFPLKQFQEDSEWVDKCCALAVTEVQIKGDPLYHYKFDAQKSATR